MRKVDRTISEVCKGVCAQKADPVHTKWPIRTTHVNNQQKTESDEIHTSILPMAAFSLQNRVLKCLLRAVQSSACK